MRIILAGPRGFCAGVNMAIESLRLAVRRYGIPVYVDPNMSGTADDSLIMVNRDSFVWYEAAGPLQLRSNIVGTGQVEVGYYGYGAVATQTAAGAYTFNLT